VAVKKIKGAAKAVAETPPVPEHLTERKSRKRCAT
jgi:hypothetical protein